METALMSGTPVPIYVKKRSNSTASTKFFRTSSKKVKHSRKKSNAARSSTGSERPADDPAKDSRPSSLENAPPPLKIEPPQAKFPPISAPIAINATNPIIGLPSPPESPPPNRKLPDIPVFTDNNWPLTEQNKNSNAVYGLSDSDASAHHNLGAKPRGRAKLVKNPSQINKAASTSPGFGYLSDGSEAPKRPPRISSPVTVWSAPDFEPARKPFGPPKPRRTTSDAATSTTSLVPALPSERRPSPVPEPPPRSPTRPRSVLLSAEEIIQLAGPEAGNMSQYLQSNGSNQINPSATYQHIQDMAAKRVSTLDYLRKTHEGRVYWFNTLLFNRNDINRLPSFDSKKLARRAANLLILGLSLPSILDLNTLGALDFLRALNALLLEFETYQQVHPADGSSASSLSRARIPQVFKRSITGTKTRRTSSATDIGLPFGSSDPSDVKSMMSGTNSAAAASTASLATSEDLLPGEEYTYLVTPSLPFDPDFFEVFASLCDVLIDCYMRITNLVSSPEKCGPGVAEVFAKADARLRKVMVAGIIKEFEDATRVGVKGEVAGIGRVILGGLM